MKIHTPGRRAARSGRKLQATAMPASSPAMRRVHNLPDGVIDLVGGGRTLEQIREAVLEGGPALLEGGNEVHVGGKDGG